MKRALVALVTAAALTLSACSAEEGTGDKAYISGDGALTAIPTADRDQAVSLSGVALDGKPIDVADSLGEVTVVNIWESWCPPCRAETPDLIKAAAQTEDIATFVGVNTEDNNAAAAAFERNYQVPYPSLADPDGRARLAFAGYVPLGALPSTVVLDQEGRVAAVFNGRVPSAITLVEVIGDIAEHGEVQGAGSGAR